MSTDTANATTTNAVTTTATVVAPRDWCRIDLDLCRARNSLFTSLSHGDFRAAIGKARTLAALAAELETSATAEAAARAAAARAAG